MSYSGQPGLEIFSHTNDNTKNPNIPKPMRKPKGDVSIRECGLESAKVTLIFDHILLALAPDKVDVFTTGVCFGRNPKLNLRGLTSQQLR